MENDLRQLGPTDYPPQLREIPQVPSSLWIRGSLPPLGTKYLAVVGSRALSPYGRSAINSLIGGLSGHPITIVSGLALGADAAAHEAAVNAKLHAVAILGSGIADEAISPRTNYELSQQILSSGGALISENPPEHTPFPSDFPKRNRLVAGIADAVLIIEAGERSGTLITARLSGEYGRDLMCVPHRITDPGAYGANLFIRLGAALVTEPGHILEVLGLPQEPVRNDELLTPEQQSLFELLESPASKDDLIRASELPAGDTLHALVTLEMKGLARERYGRWERT